MSGGLNTILSLPIVTTLIHNLSYKPECSVFAFPSLHLLGRSLHLPCLFCLQNRRNHELDHVYRSILHLQNRKKKVFGPENVSGLVNIICASCQQSGCSLVVRIPRCGRGDLGSNPSSHTLCFFVSNINVEKAL